MRVLHVTNAYPYDDYSSYGIFIKEQIESIEADGFHNSVLFINARKLGYFQYIISIKELIIQLKSFKPDLIHFHHEFSLIPFLFLYPFYRIKFVLSILGDISKRSLFNRLFFNCVKALPDVIIYKSSIAPFTDRSHYLPNGVNTHLFRPMDRDACKEYLGLQQFKKYILFVSASVNNPIKRYDKFQRIVQELKKGDPDIEELIMSGVGREIVPYFFNASSLLLLTSDHEGSPNAIKEAMSCNIPIVSTDVGNVKSLFANGSGLFVETQDDFTALVSATRLALSIKTSNGREMIGRLHLDMDDVAQQLKRIYITIVS